MKNREFDPVFLLTQNMADAIIINVRSCCKFTKTLIDPSIFHHRKKNTTGEKNGKNL